MYMYLATVATADEKMCGFQGHLHVANSNL